MKIALVHDDLIQYGGAETVLLALHDLWPDAPIYTSMASSSWQDICKSKKITLKTSFMQKLPKTELLYKLYSLAYFYNLAFESFDFSDFDVVISSSSRFAHSIVTKPETLHVSYMHSPARMFWTENAYFSTMRNSFMRAVSLLPIFVLRNIDYLLSKRVDYFIANSQFTASKIKRYYGADSKVIEPFYDLPASPQTKPIFAEPYFLIVGRLVAWKRYDLAIEACNTLKLPLVIAGTGPYEPQLKKLAGPTVKFVGFVSESTKLNLLANCRAFINPQEEDFGMVMVEALACSKPVIAYNGGFAPQLLDATSGILFAEQTVESLSDTLSTFNEIGYNCQHCQTIAQKYSKSTFSNSMKSFVEDLYVLHSKKTN